MPPFYINTGKLGLACLVSLGSSNHMNYGFTLPGIEVSRHLQQVGMLLAAGGSISLQPGFLKNAHCFSKPAIMQTSRRKNFVGTSKPARRVLDGAYYIEEGN